jgi:antitoxin ParD1/3/4
MLLDKGGTIMNVSLTPQLEAMIRERVASGRYNNASEVVRDALRHLEEHERREHLRALLAVGEDDERQGNLVDYTPGFMEDIYQEADELFRRGAEPDPDVCP